MLPEALELPTVVRGIPPDIAAKCLFSVEEWTRTLLDLLPRGIVWPRDPETVIYRFWEAIADGMVAIQTRDCALLAESFPCGATELLPDWERLLGLPDECTGGADRPLAVRRQYVCAKLTAQGGQSAAYFIALAAQYGFHITITEHAAPWAIGCAPLCEGTTVGVPWYWWTVNSAQFPITFITVGCWHLCDPLYTAEGADILECIIRRAAPAHTTVTFSYRQARAGWNVGRWVFDSWSS